jgi:3'(2'), 5'-bisphosphate nucleotidase
MDRLLEIVINAAIDAGKKIIEIYGSSDFGIEAKDDLSPITRADKSANKIIYEHLIPLGIPILSEEGKSISWETRKTWDTFWLIDPLDGTKEFIKKNGEFTVNIALIEKGNPVLGVIFVPVSCELYYGNQNGSYKSAININEITDIKQIILKSVKLPCFFQEENFLIVGSRSHLNEETEKYINQIESGGKPKVLFTKGSSLKLCMVATGEANIYPRMGPTMEWDIAAGHAIALFAGKSVTQYPSGKPLVYNKENLLNPSFVVE